MGWIGAGGCEVPRYVPGAGRGVTAAANTSEAYGPPQSSPCLGVTVPGNGVGIVFAKETHTDQELLVPWLIHGGPQFLRGVSLRVASTRRCGVRDVRNGLVLR